jgi:hypothetical protein
MLGSLHELLRHIGLRKVRYGVATWFEEQEAPLAICDPAFAQAHAHATAQRLNVQKPFGQRLGDEKASNRAG